MLLAPIYRNRNGEQIASDRLDFSSVGFFYRAVSWLDHFERSPMFTALYYACAEARLGVEHLLFEELVMSTGVKLPQEEYERCLRNRNVFRKLIRQLSPDYERIQQFSKVVWDLQKNLLPIVIWNPDELMVSWGNLSKYLHWSGSRIETIENPTWLKFAHESIANIVFPIWEKMCSGESGVLHPSNMTPEAASIWADFREGKIDLAEARQLLIKIAPQAGRRLDDA